jgi:rRNA maturation endonuclease Nob1
MPYSDVKSKQKECPGCAMLIDAKKEVCPICGYEFPKSSMLLKIAAVVLIIAIIIYFCL